VAIDLFLRVLNSVHDEVVSAEGSGHDPQLAARIKDAMRADCLPQASMVGLGLGRGGLRLSSSLRLALAS
tara:strand:+ start:118 stop:327 length:210 start_codon:yes stop_codon:yes gene_type:complete